MCDTDEGDVSKRLIPKMEQFNSNLSQDNNNSYMIEENETIFGTNMRHSFNEINYKAELDKASHNFNEKLLPNYDNLMHELVQKKLGILKDEITKLEINEISRETKERSRTIILCLSGFLSEDDDLLQEWKYMPLLYPNNEIHTQNWQSTTKLGLVKESVTGVGKVIWPIASDIASWTYERVLDFWGKNDKDDDSVSSIAPTLDENLQGFDARFDKKILEDNLSAFEDNPSEFEYQSKIDALRMQETKSVNLNFKKKFKSDIGPVQDELATSTISQDFIDTTITQKNKKVGNSGKFSSSFIVNDEKQLSPVNLKRYDSMRMECDQFEKENAVIQQLKEQRKLWLDNQKNQNQDEMMIEESDDRVLYMMAQMWNDYWYCHFSVLRLQISSTPGPKPATFFFCYLPIIAFPDSQSISSKNYKISYRNYWQARYAMEIISEGLEKLDYDAGGKLRPYKAFKRLDRDNDNYITIKDLEDAFRHYQ